MTENILTFDKRFKSNADIIVAARDLGYLTDEMRIIDLTANAEKFWAKWRPEKLVTNDLDPRFGDYHEDFRHTFWGGGEFDAVVFDPPYGLRGTSRHVMDAQYGLGEYLSVADRLALMRDGLTEAARIVRPKGYVLSKCQNQVVSGAKVWQTMIMANHGATVGLRLADEVHLEGYRAQPGGRAQKHFASNYSTLQIFQRMS